MPIIHAYLYESAGKIKKVAEILKKHLTNELQGCILAPSNGKGVVSDEGCYPPLLAAPYLFAYTILFEER